MTVVVPTLETERLILRGWQQRDFAAVAAFYADDPTSVHVGGPRSGRDVVLWFLSRAGQWALRGYGTFVIEERSSGAFVGWCGVDHYPDMAEPEVQYALLSTHRGKGYMTEAGHAALEFIFRASELSTLRTTIHPSNVSSQKVARHLGGTPTSAIVAQATGSSDVWRFAPDGWNFTPQGGNA